MKKTEAFDYPLFQQHYQNKEPQEVVKILGDFRRYQKQILAVILLAATCLGMITFIIPFIFYEPTFECYDKAQNAYIPCKEEMACASENFKIKSDFVGLNEEFGLICEHHMTGIYLKMSLLLVASFFSFFSLALSDWFGRRFNYFTSFGLIIVFSVLGYFIHSLWLHWTCFMLFYFAMDCVLSNNTVYLNEAIGGHVRLGVFCLVGVMLLFGQSVLSVISMGLGHYRFYFVLFAFLFLVIFVLMYFTLESSLFFSYKKRTLRVFYQNFLTILRKNKLGGQTALEQIREFNRFLELPDDFHRKILEGRLFKDKKSCSFLDSLEFTNAEEDDRAFKRLDSPDTDPRIPLPANESSKDSSIFVNQGLDIHTKDLALHTYQDGNSQQDKGPDNSNPDMLNLSQIPDKTKPFTDPNSVFFTQADLRRILGTKYLLKDQGLKSTLSTLKRHPNCFRLIGFCFILANLECTYGLTSQASQFVGFKNIFLNGFLFGFFSAVNNLFVFTQRKKLFRKKVNIGTAIAIILLAVLGNSFLRLKSLLHPTFYFTVDTALVIFTVFALGWGYGVVFNYGSELFPTHVRGFTMGFSLVLSRNLVGLASLFLHWSGQMGIHPLTFMALTAVVSLPFGFLMPETFDKGVSK